MCMRLTRSGQTSKLIGSYIFKTCMGDIHARMINTIISICIIFKVSHFCFHDPLPVGVGKEIAVMKPRKKEMKQIVLIQHLNDTGQHTN